MSEESNKLPGYRDLLKSIDHFFHQKFEFLAPIPIRIFDEKDVWIAEAMLPGINKKQISLDIYKQFIRIRVTQEEDSELSNNHDDTVKRIGQTQIRERIITLPFLVNEQDVRASYNNGLLRIVVPYKHRQISIE
ncbi:Hsp20/alpha crystallin family protein [bacterium LRH843]|nr:Hsp20/alpha crystallin family protein [bacterium LRH843]